MIRPLLPSSHLKYIHLQPLSHTQKANSALSIPPLAVNARESLSQFVGFYALNPMPDAQVEKSIRTQNTRDTPSPKHITELLTGIVRAVSKKPDMMLANTVYVSKRIDDHVLCERDSEAPWRRSPLWLIIRVALQTTLCEWNVEECASYKAFMLFALSSILHTALLLNQPDHLLFVMNVKLARRFCKMPNDSRDGCFVMDGVATVNKMVSDELEKHWKVIQKRTTRQVNWSAPTKEEITDGARIDLLATVPYLKEVKRRDSFQPLTGNIEKFVVPGGNQYATRYNPDLIPPPNLTNLPSSPLECTILSSGLLGRTGSAALVCLNLLVPSTITPRLRFHIIARTLNDCPWRSLP